MARPKKPVSISVSSAESSPVRKRLPREAKNGSPSRPTSKAAATKKRASAKVSKPALLNASKTNRSKSTDEENSASEVHSRDDYSSLVKAFAASTKGTTPTVSEADIYAASSPGKLADLVNSLVSTEHEALFQKLHEKSVQQQAQNGEIIADFVQQLEQRQATIDTLASHVEELRESLARAEEKLAEISETSTVSETPQKRRSGPQMYESPIRRKRSDVKVHSNDIDEEFKTIAFTFDMLELLTGVRIINYRMDDDKFIFDVKHSNTVSEQESDMISIEYQLIIQQNFEEAAEVTYVPVFLEMLEKRARDAEQDAKNKDAVKVRAHLPAYLQQGLNFPYNTLSQFYTKLSKALNKSTKG